MASAFAAYKKEKHDLFPAPIKDDDRLQTEMTPDVPGAADGPSTKWGKVWSLISKKAINNENYFGTVIQKSQRNGNLKSSDFTWSNSKTPYDNALKSITNKYK